MQSEHANPTGKAAPFLTVGDLAARLQVSRTTVYRLVETRQLPVHRVGANLRFAPEDVEAYLQRGRVPAIQEYERPKDS